jgi:hypothetical protein
VPRGLPRPPVTRALLFDPVMRGWPGRTAGPGKGRTGAADGQNVENPLVAMTFSTNRPLREYLLENQMRPARFSTDWLSTSVALSGYPVSRNARAARV